MIFLAVVICLCFMPPAWGREVRRLSLAHCIEAALAHNLDLRLERYNPTFARLNLNLAYAGYDPVFHIGGQHSYENTSGGFDSNQRVIPASETDTESFFGGLGGLLPWGMRYDLLAEASDTYGTRQSGDTNVVFRPFASSQASAQVRLTQPLLRNFWTDATRTNIAVSKLQMASAGEGLRGRIMDVVTQVEKAYFDLVAARESVRVQAMALQLARQLLADNRRRVEVGTLAPLDEKQSEAEVAVRESDLLAAERTLAVRMNALKSLLTDAYGEWHAVIIEPSDPLAGDPVPLDVQDSWSKGLTQRPELVQARLAAERQGVELRYHKNQLYPQLDAFGGYGFSGSDQTSAGYSETFSQMGRGSEPFWSAGMQLTVPLMNRGARARYRAARARDEQMVLALKKFEQDIMVEIDDAVKFARLSHQRVNATRVARGYAEAALDAEQRKLESGKSTSFIVLQLQRDLTAARSAEIDALSEYNKALAALARSEGSTLDRRGINLEAR